MKQNRIPTKRRTKTFTIRADLLSELLPACTDEYEKTFGHPWSTTRVAWVEDLTRRWKTEDEAWRVMNKFRKAAAEALDFFESRELDPNRPDNGLFHAYRLHKLLKQRRRFLQSLVKNIREDYERPADKRHWLVWSMNFAKPNAFAKLPQDLPLGRALTNRELAILSILMTQGAEVDLGRGITVSGAIEQELRRMARAAERAPARTPRKITREPPDDADLVTVATADDAVLVTAGKADRAI